MSWGIQGRWCLTRTTPHSLEKALNCLWIPIIPSTGFENRRICRCLSIDMSEAEWFRVSPIQLMGDLKAKRSSLTLLTKWALLNSFGKPLKRIIQKVRKKSLRPEWLNKNLGYLKHGVSRRIERKMRKRSSILKTLSWLRKSCRLCYRIWERKWTL